MLRFPVQYNYPMLLVNMQATNSMIIVLDGAQLYKWWILFHTLAAEL